MSRVRSVAPLLAAAILCGCKSMAFSFADARSDRAILAPGYLCPIPPPAGAGESVSAEQSVVATFRGHTYTFQAELQITPAEFDLVALDGFGRRSLTARWSDRGLDVSRASWLPAVIRPADILAYVAIVYWPANALASSLATCGLRLDNSDRARTVSGDGRQVITVQYGSGKDWNRSATLRNSALGFTIEIQSMPLGDSSQSSISRPATSLSIEATSS